MDAKLRKILEDEGAIYPVCFNVEVVPVRHGRWKKVADGIYYHLECSVCGCRPLRNRWVEVNELSLYCPNCGARMYGDKKRGD